MYQKLPDVAAAKEAFSATHNLPGEIWRQAVAASRAEGAAPPTPMLLLPALNAMIDITTTRSMATLIHPPPVVFILLFGVALAGALLAGYAMAERKSTSWLHVIGFALVTAIAIYVIIDVEYPRLGFIRVDEFDRALVELRAGMK